MTDFVLHCGSCGVRMRDCICAGLGQPPPIVAPVAPLPAFDLRYGVAFCPICNLALEYCRGHVPADPSSADARAESDLSRRIREARDTR